MLHDVQIAITTDGSGNSVDSPSYWPGEGYLVAIFLDVGTLAADMDFTMTSTLRELARTFFAKTDQTNADAVWYPRERQDDGADASALADGDGNAYDLILLDGIPIITTADGGNTTSGVIWFIVDFLR